MPKKRTKKEEKKDHYTVALEDVTSQLKFVAEMQQATNDKLDGFIVETREKFAEYDEKFETIFDYLSRIEDEIVNLRAEVNEVKKGEFDVVRIEKIEERLTQIEVSLEKNKVSA